MTRTKGGHPIGHEELKTFLARLLAAHPEFTDLLTDASLHQTIDYLNDQLRRNAKQHRHKSIPITYEQAHLISYYLEEAIAVGAFDED
jgi:hypothetical protein